MYIPAGIWTQRQGGAGAKILGTMPNSDTMNQSESIGGCPKFFRKILVEEQTETLLPYMV